MILLELHIKSIAMTCYLFVFKNLKRHPNFVAEQKTIQNFIFFSHEFDNIS